MEEKEQRERKGRKESERRKGEKEETTEGGGEECRAGQGEKQAGGRRHDRNEAQGRLGAVQTECRQGWVDSWPGAEFTTSTTSS